MRFSLDCGIRRDLAWQWCTFLEELTENIIQTYKRTKVGGYTALACSRVCVMSVLCLRRTSVASIRPAK